VNRWPSQAQGERVDKTNVLGQPPAAVYARIATTKGTRFT
jgi:hypothetical protein